MGNLQGSSELHHEFEIIDIFKFRVKGFMSKFGAQSKGVSVIGFAWSPLREPDWILPIVVCVSRRFVVSQRVSFINVNDDLNMIGLSSLARNRTVDLLQQAFESGFSENRSHGHSESPRRRRLYSPWRLHLASIRPA